MSQSIGEFRQHLVRSGLMTDEEVGHFLACLPGDKTAGDASALARELVSANRLTKYQASAIFQGRTQGLVLGKYVVLDKIGAGGIGQVFKAFDRRMERVVALKMLPASALAASEAAEQLHVAHVPRIEAQFQAMAAPEAIARLHREARAAARLHHPNIVTVFDADEADGVYFLAMEYLDGRDLASLVKERHPLPVAEVVDYVLQAARGLEYAHSHGIVHRDVKPANLVLDERGAVKVLDMGLARFVSQVGDAFDTDTGGLTQTGQVIGTVDFMSPEQAEDMRQADERSDIYSLGCTLYMLLTGRPPFSGETLIKKFLAHREAEIPSICVLRRDVPAMLDAIFNQMMAKNAVHRYQSITEVLTDMSTCQVEVNTPSAKSSNIIKYQRHRTTSMPLARPKASEMLNFLGMRFSCIPPGEFTMGSSAPENERHFDETFHQVKLTRSFYLSVCEVTQSQFWQVLGRNPAAIHDEGDSGETVAGQDTASFPVENITWFDAIEFCNALSKAEGLSEYYSLERVRRENGSIMLAETREIGGTGYRLPTEAEWEYACRGGTNTKYWIGNDPESVPQSSWFELNSSNQPHAVGQLRCNPFGLFDMAGNVWEWCNDWFGSYVGNAVDPKGPHSGVDRVLRGGAFDSPVTDLRSAARGANEPNVYPNIVGFRVARTTY